MNVRIYFPAYDLFADSAPKCSKQIVVYILSVSSCNRVAFRLKNISATFLFISFSF